MAAHSARPKDARTERPHGLPVPDAIALAYAAGGFLHSRRRVEAFAEREAFSLASVRGRGWAEWIELGIARIAEFPELLPPPPYGPQRTPEGWEPTQIDLGPLPPRGARDYGQAAVDDGLLEFDRWLEGRPPTHRNYSNFATGRPAVLSLNALLKRGALKTQLETARGGGEKYRARRHHPEPAVLPTSTPQEGAREQALTVSVHVSPLAKALLKSLADRSPKTARQLADDAGWTLGKTHYHLHALTRSGAVAAVESAARSVHQAYVPGPRFDRHLQAHAEDESA